jgi:hypothetical protein
MHLRLLALFVCFIGTGFAQAAHAPKNIREFYPPEALETLKKPDAVWAVLLRDNGKGKVKERGKQVQLSPALANEASEILTANSTYGWDDGEKLCLPIYGARLIFKQGTSVVSVNFCFACEILTFTAPSQRHASENFDAQAKPLRAIFQKTFPKDRAINSVR